MAVLTFEQFKANVLDREKRIEINKLFHLFVKSETFADIINVVKSNTNILWAINNGTLSEAILAEIPIIDLEAENIFNTTTTLSNPTKDVVVREGGDVTVNLTDDNRIKVTLLGGNATINTDDVSMAEIETYNNSTATVNSLGSSYCYLSSFHISEPIIQLNENSICKVNSGGKSIVSVDIQDDAFLNAITLWESWLKITGKIRNVKLYKRENSIISKQIK